MAIMNSVCKVFIIYFISIITSDFFATSYRIQPTENTNDLVILSESNSTKNDTCNSDHISITIEQKLEDELTSLEQNAGCGSCARRKANLTREELRELRFEVVKQQILQKLHMTEPPCPPKTPPSSLRAVIQAAEMMDGIESEGNDDTPNEMDGKAKSILIYALDDSPACVNSLSYPCSRLQFELPSSMGLTIPSSATIYLYKKKVENLLKLSEVVYNYDIRNSFIVNDLIVEDGYSSSSMVKFHLPARTSWLRAGSNEQVLDLQVSCYSGCSANTVSAIADITEDEKPFMVVNFQPTSSAPRSRRSVDCTENSIHCCREYLYINFTELGWNSWIYAPSGFEANFCKGKCQHDVNNMRSHHSTVLHTYMLTNPERAEEIGLKMCCSPSKMSDLSLLYVDFKDRDMYKDINNNNDNFKNITIVKTTLKNMIVDSCDCA